MSSYKFDYFDVTAEAFWQVQFRLDLGEDFAVFLGLFAGEFAVLTADGVNGNYECSDFGNLKCSVFSNKSTSFSVTMMQQFR